jgi:hypothetical protein
VALGVLVVLCFLMGVLVYGMAACQYQRQPRCVDVCFTKRMDGNGASL